MEAVVRRETGSKRVGRGKDAEKRLGMGAEGVNDVSMALITTAGGFCGGNGLGMMWEEDVDVKEGEKKMGEGELGQGWLRGGDAVVAAGGQQVEEGRRFFGSDPAEDLWRRSRS